jgi:histidinol-phosphatase (PHP family)
MQTSARPAWKVSLHGGHSGEFCDHAEGALRDLLTAAVAAGYHTFGVSEHAPRGEARFLYPREIELGWDVARTEALFDAYLDAITPLAEEFADRLIVLRGFEAEVVPTATYAGRLANFRARTLPSGAPAIDYFVGSVHYVHEISIDGLPEILTQAVEACGGPESLAVRYYEVVAEMATTLCPDVVGHLDLIKRNWTLAGYGEIPLDTPRIRAAAEQTLEAVRSVGAILDLNTAGWRKGLGEPYPAPWLVQKAAAMGVPFCFGDDSHRASDVGAGVLEARDYLLQNGVTTVTVLTREDGAIVRRVVSL